jgi:hypothetical protein
VLDFDEIFSFGSAAGDKKGHERVPKCRFLHKMACSDRGLEDAIRQRKVGAARESGILPMWVCFLLAKICVVKGIA